MDDDLRDRLEAVERAITDGEADLEALSGGAATADRVATVESDLAALEDEVAELQAATQALRGYVGNVRSVNEQVEDRADLALSKVERLAPRSEETSKPSSDDGGIDPAPGRTDPGANGRGRPGCCPTCGRQNSSGAEVDPSPGRDQSGETGPESEAVAAALADLGQPGKRRDTGTITDSGSTPGEGHTATEDTGASDRGLFARARELL